MQDEDRKIALGKKERHIPTQRSVAYHPLSLENSLPMIVFIPHKNDNVEYFTPKKLKCTFCCQQSLNPNSHLYCMLDTIMATSFENDTNSTFSQSLLLQGFMSFLQIIVFINCFITLKPLLLRPIRQYLLCFPRHFSHSSPVYSCIINS